MNATGASKSFYMGLVIGIAFGSVLTMAITAFGLHSVDTEAGDSQTRSLFKKPEETTTVRTEVAESAAKTAEDCQTRIDGTIRAFEKLSSIQFASLAGVEIPWNNGIPELYRPETVRERLEEAKVACSMIDESSFFLECDEYPCILWMKASSEDALYGISSCAVWPYHPQFEHLMITGTQDFQTPAFIRVMGLGDDSPGEYSVSEVKKRTDYRVEFWFEIAYEEMQ